MRERWHIPAILALALGGFGIGTTEFVTMGLLPDIASAVHVDEPTAGHVVSAYALGVVVGAPLITALAARMPRKRLLVLLMVAFTLGNALTVFAPTYGTLVAARFLTGLPHGAYFGVASLAAASLAPAGQRAKAVSALMLGLTVANVIGVPAATWIGQHLGWRDAFAIVAVIGAAAVAAVWLTVPPLHGLPKTDPRTELRELRKTQVLLTLLIGAVGFGGMFAVYTYVATTLTSVTGMSSGMVPLMLMLFGLGMVAGNLLGGVLADRAQLPAMIGTVLAMIAVQAAFIALAHNPWTAALGLFAVAATGCALAPMLQTRLMDVAAEGQSLAAALNHAALNVANAAGAWLGGLVIAAGLGYTAPSAVGAALALAGLGVLLISVRLERSTK